MQETHAIVQLEANEALAARQLLSHILATAKNGVVQLSPQDAAVLVRHLNFPKQRGVKASRVEAKLADMRAGDWEKDHAITFVVLPGGAIYLVDGQHRLTAISLWHTTVPLMINVVSKPDLKSAQKYYSTFDGQSAVRTTRELLDAVDLPSEVGLTKSMAKAVYDAAQLLASNLEPMNGSANVASHHGLFRMNNRIEVVQKWASEAREFEQILKAAHFSIRKMLMGTGVLAVALVTLRYQPATARQFWRGIAENDGLRKADPRSTFLADLMTRNMAVGSVRQRVQQPAVAWNAFYQGRELKIIKCIPDAAIVVAGTPFDGKGGM